MDRREKRKRYEFLEHTADAYIAAYGATLEEAFENAALATFDVMTDVGKVKPQIEDSVKVEAHDEFALLYSWLEALLIKFEITGNLYSRFKVSSIKKTSSGLRLKAKIWGDPFNSQKHPQKVGVKAVTYHQMKIVKKAAVITVLFILDI
jgi:SHS2 domain-containing protein